MPQLIIPCTITEITALNQHVGERKPNDSQTILKYQ